MRLTDDGFLIVSESGSVLSRKTDKLRSASKLGTGRGRRETMTADRLEADAQIGRSAALNHSPPMLSMWCSSPSEFTLCCRFIPRVRGRWTSGEGRNGRFAIHSSLNSLARPLSKTGRGYRKRNRSCKAWARCNNRSWLGLRAGTATAIACSSGPALRSGYTSTV